MLDLDAIEKQAEAFDHDRRTGAAMSADQVLFCYLEDVPALVAELRAAREVIEIARYADAPGLRAAIHAYDYAMRDED